MLRPAVWSALLGAIVAAAMANPVYAEPPLPNTVPNTGSRPAVSGPLQLPGASRPVTGPTQTVPVTTGPLASQLYALETEVATLGEQLLLLRETVNNATTDVQVAEVALAQAKAATVAAQAAADAAAAEALKEAAGLPPGEFGSDLHGFGSLSRLERGGTTGADTTGPAALELLRAKQAEQEAQLDLWSQQDRLRVATEQFTAAEKTYKQREKALLELREKNKDQLEAIEREREAAEQRLGAELINQTVNGMRAHPRALAAVRYADAQRGDPYEWAAEGPDRFDCSGLVWAAYRSKGADYYKLPRVSRDQYNFTRGKTVARKQNGVLVGTQNLLPGDLIFFASGDSPSSIYHMGMYYGNGKMIVAPTTGDFVKFSTVTWSRFYAATRVFDAVPAPSSSATASKPPTPKPTSKPPTPKPTTPKPTTGAPTTPPTTPPTTGPTTAPSSTAPSPSPEAQNPTPTPAPAAS